MWLMIAKVYDFAVCRLQLSVIWYIRSYQLKWIYHVFHYKKLCWSRWLSQITVSGYAVILGRETALGLCSDWKSQYNIEYYSMQCQYHQIDYISLMTYINNFKIVDISTKTMFNVDRIHHLPLWHNYSSLCHFDNKFYHPQSTILYSSGI